TAFELINRDRIGSEKESLNSNAQIESLITSSSQGIAFFSPEGYIIRANDIFKKYLNVKSNKADINSMPAFRDMIGLKNKESISEFIKNAGAGKNFELNMTVGNEARYISLNLFPVQTKHFEVIGLGLSFIDITHLKQIEHELIVSRDKAEVSNRAKSFFLANMSHEIRTPIGVIMGFVDILNSTPLSDDEKRSNMSIIKRNCRQLLNIIDDILDLSKVEFGQIKIRKETISILELLEDLKSILDLKTQDKNIKIDVKITGKVPAEFSSDNTRLRQIILNICGNATKFTKTGSITVDCFFANSQMNFRVTDTGPGVAVEDIHKLFKPFSQIDSSETREFGGTGLGLALSKKLAIALGGDLILEKTVLQQGSTFLLHVDVGESESQNLIDQTMSDNTSLIPAPEVKINSMQLKDKKILIVDDSPDNRLLLSFILKQFGAISDTANDGKAAVEKALHGDSKYDLVLMDLQMPIMGGYEAVSELRKLGFDKPIIALTAHAMKEEKEKCLSSGFTNYLTKPITRNTLLDMISSSL
ncbi:MAG: response regulator, partial [Bdellovibrionaceae bacterium]|nr:response regulator [Pseudobdellovibrionaceae bacterium]